MKISLYGNYVRVPGEFEHDGYAIIVYQMEKGGLHCDFRHDFRSRGCTKCGAPVQAERVFMGFVEGKQATKDCDSADEAVRIAKLYIDHMFGEDDDDEDDESDLTGALADRARKLSTIEQLGWATHAMALVKQDEEAAQRALPSK